jgi:predicted nucleic acid-binding protein
MNTLNFLDVNVWLELLWNRHAHSEQAREGLERSADEQFLFCRSTQIMALWLITTKEIMGKDTKNMAMA